MLETQREGIARAKAEGKYKGRAPTARAKAEEVLMLLKGGMGATKVARKLKIGRAPAFTVFSRRSNELLEAVESRSLG
jgi:DNA invertase Pin-like site-specific DNA recombinase